ncbi:hypothetical protein RHMOL_Rhmol02G0171300 [Rhododendron molle]|uniref:Uncharacterized protein n=1 Tax=Rhododendron molle TaxID=49168 RepID=A0ACC0PR82_RHOML|nr:hypothetical protein RHMOL_Rhmol02G0171300 [Rhododendron molle]
MEVRAKHHLFTRNNETHIVIEPELLFGVSEETLELRVSQERDRNYVLASLLSDVHRKMAFRYIEGKVVDFGTFAIRFSLPPTNQV